MEKGVTLGVGKLATSSCPNTTRAKDRSIFREGIYGKDSVNYSISFGESNLHYQCHFTTFNRIQSGCVTEVVLLL